MSFLAKLFMNGRSINLLDTNVQFYRNIHPSTFQPTTMPMGGGFTFTVEADSNTDLLRLMISPDAMCEGYIRFYKRDGFSKLTDYEFFDTHVVNYHFSFDGVHGTGANITYHFSSGILRIGDMVFEKHWKVTDLKEREEASAVPIAPSPRLAAVKWKSIDGETIGETAYDEKVGLEIKVANPEGGRVEISIEKEDGTEFENGQKSLSFTEYITEEGKAQISALEIKNEWEDFKTSEVDGLVAKVSHKGTNKKSKVLSIVPTPKVLVNFRTGNAYNGDYGFDWMRMADTGKPGDVWYKDIIGDYATGSFVQSDTEYAKLGRKFEMPQHPLKANDKYVVPVMTLLPNKKAVLTLKVEVEGSEAKKIEYKYDTSYFKLDKTEVSHKSVGKKELADELSIECIKEFDTDQFIEVEADGKFAGKLRVLANDKAHRYRADIVFVKVKTDLNAFGRVKTGSDLGEEMLLNKYLMQALTKSKISIKELDLTSDPILNSTYRLLDGTMYIINDTTGIHAHLENEFSAIFSGYNNAIKVFMFDEVGGELDGGSMSYYNGAAKAINSKSVVVYNTRGTSTTTHEVLHAAGLYHSLSDSGDFTLQKLKTDNIMDYSHQVGINRISTYRWQWETVWPNFTKE